MSTLIDKMKNFSVKYTEILDGMCCSKDDGGNTGPHFYEDTRRVILEYSSKNN